VQSNVWPMSLWQATCSLCQETFTGPDWGTVEEKLRKHAKEQHRKLLVKVERANIKQFKGSLRKGFT